MARLRPTTAAPSRDARVHHRPTAYEVDCACIASARGCAPSEIDLEPEEAAWLAEEIRTTGEVAPNPAPDQRDPLDVARYRSERESWERSGRRGDPPRVPAGA